MKINFQGGSMKYKSFLKFIFLFIMIFTLTFPVSLLNAAEQKNDTEISTTGSIRIHTYETGMDFIFADATEQGNITENTTVKSKTYDINWHKILGLSTVGMAIVTLGSGPLISHNGHCPLAGVTTGLAAATCVTGYYKYGSIISFTDGDWKLNTHALVGTLATIGFITTLALAGDNGSEAHVTTGVISGVAFAVTLGVLYF
jgi:hypothetical protein